MDSREWNRKALEAIEAVHRLYEFADDVRDQVLQEAQGKQYGHVGYANAENERAAVSLFRWRGFWLEPEGRPLLAKKPGEKGTVPKEADVFLFYACMWRARIGVAAGEERGPELFAGAGRIRLQPWASYPINQHMWLIGDTLNALRRPLSGKIGQGYIDFPEGFRWTEGVELSNLKDVAMVTRFIRDAVALIPT